MEILIDCRAFWKEGTSASVYIFNLIKNLIKDKKYKFIIVLNNRNYIEYFLNHKNVEVIYSNIKNNIFWDNLVIPYYAFKKGADIIFYTKSSSCWFKIPKKKIVTTIHGMIYKIRPEDYTFIENVYWRFVGKISSIIANKIIVVSQSDKNDLIAFGYDSSKLLVIPIGISDSFFLDTNKGDKKIIESYNLTENKYFIQLGHISRKKNQKFTTFLFYEILKKYPDLKLVFIGSSNKDSNYYSKILNYISNLGIAKNVIFTGVVDQTTNQKIIPTLLNRSLCAFFPSTYEGFGIPAVEAIAAGTPVLASDRGSLPEVLGKENVIPLEEEEKWLEVINKLIEDKNYRNHLISKQKTIVEKYRWKNIAEEYLKLFNSLMGERV